MEVIYVEVGLDRATETRQLHNTIIVIKRFQWVQGLE